MDIYENIDIIKMYKYQIDDLSSKEYEKYTKYLNYYFSKETKKDKYTRELLDDKYILVDNTNPKKKIIITPSEFMNIHILYIELKKKVDIILFKITNLIETKSNITENNRNEFERLKKEYVTTKEKIRDIEIINNNYFKEIDALLTKKIDLSNEMVKYYQKRNDAYGEIKVFISTQLKKKLIYMFKVNKNRIISLSIINKVAKENNIPSIEIEKWFTWIESVYYYMLNKREITKITTEINELENNFDMNTNHMIIKKPVIEELI